MDRLRQFVFGGHAQTLEGIVEDQDAPVSPAAAQVEGQGLPRIHPEFGEVEGNVMANAQTMKSLEGALQQCMQIQGAVAVAVVDLSSGMVLDKVGGAGLDLDLAGEGNAEVVRAKLRAKESLGIKDGIEDILITLTNQYHLIRVLGTDANIFLYLVLNRSAANLAMARRELQKVEDGLTV